MKRPEKMHTPKLFKNMKFVAYTDEMTPKINLQINGFDVGRKFSSKIQKN